MVSLSELRENPFSFYVVLPEDADRGSACRRVDYGIALYALSVGKEVFLPSFEVATRFQHSLEFSNTSAEYQHLQGCDVIKQGSPSHNALQFFIWQIFVKHSEVVAEIEVSLARITMW